MDFGLTLNLEQKQEIVMTPRLQMAIELLQYSSQDLEEYVDEELKANPLLEKEEITEKEKMEARLANQYYRPGYNSLSTSSEDETDFENFISYQPNLIEHLEGQLYQVLDDGEMKVGQYIIGNLDEDGFLILSVSEISDSLTVSREKVSRILKKVQQLAPIGIAARSLQETLLIQLNSMSLDTELAEILVANHLELIAEEKFAEIIKKVDAEEDRIMGAINLIKTLQPCPAGHFQQGENAEYIEPDIVIKKVKGKYEIIFNEKASPILRINPHYYRMLQQANNDETHKFLKDKFKSALWLIKSIEHRRITVFRIIKEVVEEQKEFLEQGIKYLRPLTMQEIADKIEMHESTVSRATNEKYVQTPQGMYKMKFFFCSGVNNVSSVSIKAMIIDYIENEDKSAPLSDSKIAELLKKNEGINVSRRTVAKYRNELSLPSSVKRKK
ncbi:MAG: RNA polymerase factor sigma-54 [Halanaerobiales bacterium]